MSKIFIDIEDILKGWKYASHAGETSVGRIAAWGGHYICIIHDDVPEDEREEVAKFISEAPEAIKDLQKKLKEERRVIIKLGEIINKNGLIKKDDWMKVMSDETNV